MRNSGILMHISSLANNYGIGKLGKEAYAFIDFLIESKQKLWQILPISQTSYGDSPYQSFSCYAGNPYFIDFETLEEEGLLESSDYKTIEWSKDDSKVDYQVLFDNVYTVLKKSYIVFKASNDKTYSTFKKENSWVNEYGLFMALKNANEGKAWYKWADELKLRQPQAIKQAKKDYAEDIDFYIYIQYKFFSQWNKIKTYANENGIKIIGDIPIYSAYDSVEVWCEPKLFQLDENLNPIDVAGFPPDAFSEGGQLWGNPLYRWDEMKKDGFKWWVNRVSYAKGIYDIVRLDHFIGFDRYYAIPYGDIDAKNGEWRDGPKYDLFEQILKQTGKGSIIAEDLGIVTPSVVKLLKKCGYPSMKVLQFAFSPDAQSEYLPQNYTSSNCVVYTGTHDSDTVLGFAETTDRKTLKYCKKYLGINKLKDFPSAFIKLAWQSTANTAIVQAQDLLGLDNSSRMNIPSTVGGNWQWRASKGAFTKKLAKNLRKITELSGR